MISILEGNEKLIFKLEGTNIIDRFGTPLSKKFKAMEKKFENYTKHLNSDKYVRYNFLKGDIYTPFFLEIENESASLKLKYKLITSDSEYGDLILTFTLNSIREDKYKEIYLSNKVLGIKLIEKIINNAYDVFVKETIEEELLKKIEEMI